MARSKGSANLAASLEVLAGAPLDARLLVNEITDLTAEGSYPYFYEGMVVVVKSEEKQYMLIGNDPTDENNWKALGTGGGGGSDSYSDLSNKPQINSVTLSGNKSSSDLGLQDEMQLVTLPAASAEYEGKIVQYVGTASGDLIPGYFYQCVSDGEDPATYSWVAKNVQAGGGSGGTSDYDELTNKPAINGVTLSGDKSTADLGIAIPASIDDLTDINLDTPADGQILVYDATNSEWINANPGSGSVAELGDVGDVNLTSVSDGQILKWDANNSEWINANESVGSSALEDLSDVTVTTPTDGQILKWDDTNSEWVNADESTGVSDIGDLSDVTLTSPTDGQVLLYDDTNSEWINADVPGVDEIADIGDVEITDIADGQILKWDDTNSKWINANAGGGGGDAALEADVTSNLAVGAIPSGTTLAEGTTFTEFVQKLLITEIAPTTTFTATGSGVKEVGTSVTPTLTLVINTVGTGTPTAIKFYDGSTLLDTKEYVDGTTSYSYTMSSAVTTTTTVKGVLEYKKSDNTNATVEKTATYTFVMASYYGAVTTAPTDKAGITALTKNVKNTKAQTATFTLSNQRSCYCYPASFGNLTSIKDANNFEYLASYTKTTVAVDGTDYNVYTLTDPVTATGFKQVYA